MKDIILDILKDWGKYLLMILKIILALIVALVLTSSIIVILGFILTVLSNPENISENVVMWIGMIICAILGGTLSVAVIENWR